MADILPRDQNFVPAAGAVSSADGVTVLPLRVDPSTGRLLVTAVGTPGSGTVTELTFTDANGVSGVVTNPTTTPDLTISLGDIEPTSVNGVVLSGTSNPELAVEGAATISGANTGDQDLFSTVAVTGQPDIVASSPTDTLRFAAGANVTVTTNAGTKTVTVSAAADVAGPASSTDNALARWDSTTGKLLQDSTAILSDAGGLSLTVPDAGNAVALTVTQDDVTNNPAALVVNNAGTNPSVWVVPTGNATVGASTGGTVLLNNTQNLGTGLNVYSDAGASTAGANLLRVTADNPSYNQNVVAIQNDGTADALVVTAAQGDGLVLSGATAQNLIRVTPTGNTGLSLGTSGAFLMDFTGTAGFAFHLYTNRDATGLSFPQVVVHNENAAYNQPLVQITNKSTLGASPHLRLDGPSPQIEWRETGGSGSAGNGQFETQVQGDIFFVNGRNSGDTSFDNAVWFLRPSVADGMNGNVGIGANPFGIEKLTVGDATGGPAGIALKERASAPGTDAGYGKLYVLSSDDLLRYQTEGGAEYVLAQAYGTGVSAFLATPSSANLRAALTDETGTGSAVFATSPALVTPTVATSITPATNDGAALGTSSLGFSDLFLSSGDPVINWNAGATTLTHNTASNFLQLAGGGLRTSSAGIGINKANSASIALDILTGSTFTQGIRVQSDLATRLGLSSYVTGDAQVRFTFRTDGLLAWGDGTSAGDTNLYRSAANFLMSDDTVGAAVAMHVRPANSIPAGGVAGAGFLMSSASNFGVFHGSGAPTLSAAKGSLYLRSDGSGTGDRMYVNTDGSTTWTAVVTAA